MFSHQCALTRHCSGKISLMSSNPLKFRPLPSAIAVGCLFALCMVAGQSLAEAGDFSQIFGGARRIVVSIAKFLLYATASSLLLNLLFLWLDGRLGAEAVPRVRAGVPTRASHLRAFADRHVFVLSLVILAVCWGAYIAAFLPGTLTYDGARSLNQFCAGAPL